MAGNEKSGRKKLVQSSSQRHYRAIREYILNPDSPALDDVQQMLMDRYVDLYNLIKRHGQNKRVVIRAYKSLRKNSDDLPADIHLMREMQQAMQLFGDIDRINKKVLQVFLVDEMMEDLQNYKALGSMGLKYDDDGILLKAEIQDKKDLDVYERMQKLKNATIKNLIEASGVNKVEPDMPDFSKLEKHDITINIDPLAQRVITKMMEGGTSFIDLGEIYDHTIIEEAEIIESKKDDE